MVRVANPCKSKAPIVDSRYGPCNQNPYDARDLPIQEQFEYLLSQCAAPWVGDLVAAGAGTPGCRIGHMDHTGCINRCCLPYGLLGLLTPGGVRLVTWPILAVINWCVDCKRTKNCKDVWPPLPRGGAQSHRAVPGAVHGGGGVSLAYWYNRPKASQLV
jgi:hypothetical protein